MYDHRGQQDDAFSKGIVAIGMSPVAYLLEKSLLITRAFRGG